MERNTFAHRLHTHVCFWQKTPISVEKEVPPAGVEHLLQHTGLTHKRKQGGTKSGMSSATHDIDQATQLLAELSPDVLENLIEVIARMIQR